MEDFLVETVIPNVAISRTSISPAYAVIHTKKGFQPIGWIIKETVNGHFEGEKVDYAIEMAGKTASSFLVRIEIDSKFKNIKEHEE